MIINLYLQHILFLIFASNLSWSYIQDKANSIQVQASYHSYYKRDTQGVYLLRNGKPYHDKGQSEKYTSTAFFSPKNTAIIIIDPWNNSPSKILNEDSDKLINIYLAPLAYSASTQGYKIYIFSNDCKAIKPEPYSCGISTSLRNLVKSNQDVTLQYWQGFDKQSFAEELKNKGITQLIYTGFDSNMCILTRPAGLVNMQTLGFKLYFIPEASSAIELPKTRKNQEIHQFTTIIISQSIAKIIHYKNIYSAFSNNKNIITDFLRKNGVSSPAKK